MASETIRPAAPSSNSGSPCPASAAVVSSWPHRIACLLVTVTAVLLSFGALVTTYEAALAVPDWPATYGHNMLLFPWVEWLTGPWDLFLEHGHRLLGALAGMVTLALVAVAWRSAVSPAVRWLSVAALLLVVLQGGLGGARVLLDDKTVAKVHACTGPLFFAVAVAVAVLSRPRSAGPQTVPSRGAIRSAVALLLAAYVQLVAGAQLRHLDGAVEPAAFRTLVGLHVVGAVAVVTLAAVCAAVMRDAGSAPRRWARVILGIVICQVALGCGAWIVNWGLPAALLPESWGFAEPIRARSVSGATVVTGHVVLGMLILGAAVVLAIESGCLRRPAPAASAGARRGRGVAAERAFA